MIALISIDMPIARSSQPVHGLWVAPKSGATIRLDYCENKQDLCGVIVDLPDDMARTDIHNPDEKDRSRPLLGLRLLWDFSKVGEQLWVGGGEMGNLPGRIYLPSNGDTLGDAKNTYELRFDGADSLTIQKKGCRLCFVKSVWKRKKTR